MANRFYDRERFDPRYGEEERYWRGPRYGRDRYSQGEYDEYGGEPFDRRYGGYYNEPFIGPDYGRDYNEHYGGRYEEPYERGYSYGGRYSEPYYRGRYGRGARERGFFERAGDEVRSWFGDEEAERRRRMDHVRSGNNAGRGPRGYKRSDERIREDVNDRLTDDYFLDASEIEVSVNDRVVTLTGMVNSREDKRRAEDIASSVSGVTDVTNHLRVGLFGQFQTTSATEAASGTRARTTGT